VATNQYLDAAVACIRLAEQTTDPSRKLRLIDMAQFWVKMAQEVEKTGGPTHETPLPVEPSPAKPN
jgi:hypothetical protein